MGLAPATGAETGGNMNHIPSQLTAELNASQVPTSEPQHDMLWACLRLRKDAYDWVNGNYTTVPEERLAAAMDWGDKIVMDVPHATTARGALLALETLREDMEHNLVSVDDALPTHLLDAAIDYLRGQ